ncbi:trans-sulfuration enzyme family protein [Treponema primitia]|uniref:trans-sulfuration enzyme family protein n=1 Tax=Treponema primitia TaxID=88058 RepID=UPI0002555578|nr:PLP-dependent aspartate aminotransferase family protein [Treponema primitia]
MNKGTELIHNGHETDPLTGALGVTIYQTSTFLRKDISKGPGSQEFDYSRGGHPTRQALEEIIATLEGGAKGYAFGSGMAAISSVLGLLSAGDHVIAAEEVYGGSIFILNNFYKRMGIETTLVDSGNPANIRAAIRPNTRALYLETPSNPLLKITDLAACLAIAREAGLLSIVDNTFMTPYLQQPIKLGADIVVHSATKFLGGHSDVVLGLAVTRTEELGEKLHVVQNSFGAIPGPWDEWLVIRGIKTLKVRLETQQSSAQQIAEWLLTHKNVSNVYYPGLSGHPGREIHQGQASGPGAMLSFKTKTVEQALRFYEKVQLAAAAPSLGGVETIASRPVTMSNIATSAADRERLGITDTLIRLAIGLEGAEDLIADFDQALA